MREEIINVRPYRPGDEYGLISCWNRNLHLDVITERIFVNKVLCDPNFDPEGLVVAESIQGDIVGFMVSLVRRVPLWGADLEPEDGWITAFATDATYRRQGVARRMLEAVETFLERNHRKQVLFSPYAPYYFVPGIDKDGYPNGAAFLAKSGFETRYECVAMDKSLVGMQVPADVQQLAAEREEEGYQFVNLQAEHVVETIRLSLEHFHADWARAVREALQKGVPYGNFLVALHPENRVVGFCMFGGYDHSPDRFGPFGVHPSQRGRGLGKALLYLGLQSMYAQGLHDAWFLWTGEKSPAGQLYQRAGFSVTRRFSVMRKLLV